MYKIKGLLILGRHYGSACMPAAERKVFFRGFLSGSQ